MRWLLCLVMVVSATVGYAQEKKQVVIASKNFPESRLLGEILAQLIERDTDIEVVRKLNLGYSKIVFEALQNGDIDIYPEYTGTAWEEYLKKGTKVSDPLEAYAVVSEEMKRTMGIEWLLPFGFQNSFAMAMKEEKANAMGIVRISDLRDYQNDLKVGVSADFFERNDGFAKLIKDYQLKFPSVRTMEHGLVYGAVDSDQINLTDVWTTDGKLARYNLRILEDDRGFFPPYHCAPLIRTQTLEKYPELRTVINTLAFTIDEKIMQAMNSQVENARDDATPFKNVAASFLAGEFNPDDVTIVDDNSNSISFLSFIQGRSKKIFTLTLEHILLAGIAVILAMLISIPLGIWLTRQEKLAAAVLGLAGVIQTIPSLALLAVMIPFFGLGSTSAVIALCLYALLPIIRNTYTGIREIDRDLIEAARGIGLTNVQILYKIELPLATRTIMAGVRTAAVISIGVATLAALIGAGGLGEPILTGMQLNDLNWILSGAVPAAILALVVDFGLGLLERSLRSRGLDA